MDRFIDDVARVLADETTRRGALRRLGGVLAGLAVAAVVPSQALAARGGKGHGGGGDNGGGDKIGGSGNGKRNKGGNSSCAHFCKALPEAQRGKCVSDAAHRTGLCYNCGPKGNKKGLCGTICCPSGQDCCGGVCKDLATDVNNCGTCGNVCPSTGTNVTGATCSSGACGFTCAAGWGKCGADTACTTDLNTTSNCGACGNVCAAGQSCSSGACI